VPEIRKLEQVRLAGSDTSRPLGEGLVDFDPDTMPPTPPFIQTGHSGKSFVRLGEDGTSFQVIAELPDGCTKLIEFRDGSKAQFQGLHAFLVYSLFERLTGVGLTNVCCEAEDGKGAADGLSRVVSQGARTLALQGFNAGSESRGLFELVATHRQRPKRPRIEKRAFTAATNYLFCFAGPSDGAAFADFKAKAGYTGSSRDHHYVAAPLSRSGDPLSRSGDPSDCDRGFIQHTNRPCPCDQCLQGQWDRCTVTRLFENATGTAEIERCKGVAARAATRSKVTKAFTASVKAKGTGYVVAVRVHSEEPNDLSEPYFLAVVDRDEGASGQEELVWRNNKTQMIDSNVVNKNVCLLRLRWLHYRGQTAQPPAGSAVGAGARGYQFETAEKTFVFPAQAVLTKVKPCAALQQLCHDGEHWWLPEAAHKVVMADGLDLLL